MEAQCIQPRQRVKDNAFINWKELINLCRLLVYVLLFSCYIFLSYDHSFKSKTLN